MKLTLDCSKPTTDWWSTEGLLVEATAELFSQNYGNAIGKIVNAYRGRVTAEETIAQAICRFWQSSFALAMTETLGRNRWARTADKKDLDRVLAEMMRSVFDGAELPECEIVHLEEPTTFPPYEKLRAIFPHHLRALEPGLPQPRADTTKAQREVDTSIAKELDHSIRLAVWRVWADEGSAKFQDAVSRLEGPVVEGLRRRMAWRRHYDWLEEEVARTPLLLQNNPNVTLKAVYTPLRTRWEEQEEASKLGKDEFQIEWRRKLRRIHIGWLEVALRSWLASGADKDRLRVIAGGPGCGKTSFARLFALDIAS